MAEIIAQMVVRNESSNYLHQVMERICNQVDKVVVTDDASDDDTPNICEHYGATVFQMPEPMFVHHEGKLRQQAWENMETQVSDPNNTWILAIDADEELYETRKPLKDIIQTPRFEVFNIQFYHMWNETQYRIDKEWKPHPSTRFFKYYEGGLFKNSQLACGSEPIYVFHLFRQRKFLFETGLKMKHLSYMTDEGKKNKYERYMQIDHGDFHSLKHIQSIMDEKPILEDWQW